MTTNTGTRSLDVFPYRHAGLKLGFEVNAYWLDNGTSEWVGGAQEIDVSRERNWTEGELTVTLSVDQDTLNYVFPAGESNDGALCVLGYCPANHYRFAEPIEAGDLSAGIYRGNVPIKFESLRGRVMLTPQLLRTTTRRSGDRYASEPAHMLATGSRATLHVDDDFDASSDLLIIETPFKDESFPADESNTWYVDFRDPAVPKLWINEEHPFMKQIMEARGQSYRGRLSDVVLDAIGIPMLTEFTLKAASLLATSGEMKYRWQERLLTDLCKNVFGDDPDPSDVEEMLQPETVADTVNSIETVIQRRYTPHENIEYLLRFDR